MAATDENNDDGSPRRLGEKLFQIRARLNLTQRQMLDLVGLHNRHHAFVSLWERGYREPSLITVLRYAQSVGVSTDALLDDDLDLPFDDESVKKPSVKRKKKKSPVKRTRNAK